MTARLASVQALRALAAVLVAYAHSIDTQMQFAVSRQQNFLYLQDFGAIGVDLFFVISGFIITLVACEEVGTRPGVRFLVKRFIRVNPAYYLASLLFEGLLLTRTWLAVGARSPGNGGVDLYSFGLLRSFADTLAIVPVSASYFAFTPFLVIGWTLAFEWLFYLLFFLLIVSRTSHKVAGLLLQILALVGAGYALRAAGYTFRTTDYRVVFATNPLLLEFLLGVAICGLYLRVARLPRWLPPLCAAVGLAGYAYSIAFGFGEISEMLPVLSAHSSLKRVLWWGLPSAFLAAGCVLAERAGQARVLWHNRWLQRIGDASYSLYLVHLSVFALCRLAYTTWGFFLPADVAVVAQLVLAVAVGLVAYAYVEQPLLRALHRRWRV